MNHSHLLKAAEKRYEAFTRDYYSEGPSKRSYSALHNSLAGLRSAFLVAEADGEDTLKARVALSDLDKAAFNLTFS